MFLKLSVQWLLLATALVSGVAKASCNSIKTYPIPDGVARKASYEVKVRSPGGAWHDLEIYETRHQEVNVTTGRTATYTGSLAYFDFQGRVEVAVSYKAGSITKARIRPDSFNIVPAVDGDSIAFALDKPKNLVVHATENVFDVLHLFSNSIVDESAAKNDPNTLYYGPGYHVANDPIVVESGKTLYVAGGAVLKASVSFDNQTGAALRGHGMLYKSSSHTISAWQSKDILIKDIIVLNPGHYTAQIAESDGVTISGLRSFSAVQWGDGIDVFSSKNVLIDNVFLRTSDDSIAIYTHRWDFYGDTQNVTVQNSILWADLAHPINIGTHGNSINPETLSDLTFSNLDILDHREFQMGYQGCIAINPGDSNLVKDVLIEDVRVENFRHGQLITMMVMYNQKYNTSPGRGISNVTIRNLDYKGTNAGTAIMTGYNETRGIEFVKFENLTINGPGINDKMAKPGWYLTSDFFPMYANEHVKNLTFT
ncbi:Polygalacturonase like protein [Verticillium longisporum]